MSIATFRLVALDCPDPLALARFYQRITGGQITTDPDDPEWVRLDPGSGCQIGFQQIPNHLPPEWPDGLPQQAHLDFEVADLDQGEAAVLAIGARKTTHQPAPEEWRVFLDPAGHPFCLVTV
jgi:catechol 2,3-dioxygenase-like lactoylglutathione lyase family enzyme